MIMFKQLRNLFQRRPPAPSPVPVPWWYKWLHPRLEQLARQCGRVESRLTLFQKKLAAGAIILLAGGYFIALLVGAVRGASRYRPGYLQSHHITLPATRPLDSLGHALHRMTHPDSVVSTGSTDPDSAVSAHSTVPSDPIHP